MNELIFIILRKGIYQIGLYDRSQVIQPGATTITTCFVSFTGNLVRLPPQILKARSLSGMLGSWVLTWEEPMGKFYKPLALKKSRNGCQHAAQHSGLSTTNMVLKVWRTPGALLAFHSCERVEKIPVNDGWQQSQEKHTRHTTKKQRWAQSCSLLRPLCTWAAAGRCCPLCGQVFSLQLVLPGNVLTDKPRGKAFS